jgi:threonine/homoserine/homoserine lactone efflux protein
LWRRARGGFAGAGARPVGPLRVAVTTLLNPKAGVFAFAILPPSASATQALYLAGLAMLVSLIGGVWILLGALLSGAGRGVLVPASLMRASGLAMAVFALLLAGAALRA